MIQLNTHGLNHVLHLQYLPDGRIFAHTVNGFGIWNASDGSRTELRLGYRWFILPTLAGDEVLVSDTSTTTGVYSLQSLQRVKYLAGNHVVTNLCYTADGQHVVGKYFYSINPDWYWWNAKTWEIVEAPCPTPLHGFNERTWISHRNLKFSPCGKYATTYGDGPIRMRNLKTGEGHTLRPPVESDLQVLFSPDGEHIVVWSRTKLYIMNLNTHEVTRELSISSRNRVNNGAFTPDGKYLFMVGNDKLVYVIDTSIWKVIHNLDWPVGKLNSIAISPDGLTAVTGGRTTKMVLWDLDF